MRSLFPPRTSRRYIAVNIALSIPSAWARVQRSLTFLTTWNAKMPALRRRLFDQIKLDSKLHRTFMAEVGEEMCQSEVAHHANRCPEYFISRPEKQVHLYKKALVLDKEKKTRRPPMTSTRMKIWRTMLWLHLAPRLNPR